MKKTILILFLGVLFLNASDLFSKRNQTENISKKKYILSVIKNGSNKYRYPLGTMPANLINDKEAQEVATYIINGLKGEAPHGWEVCAGCHGKDGKGNGGLSPDISNISKLNQNKPIIKKDPISCLTKKNISQEELFNCLRNEISSNKKEKSQDLTALKVIPIVLFLAFLIWLSYKFIKFVNKKYNFYLLTFDNIILALLYTIGIVIDAYLIIKYGFNSNMQLNITILTLVTFSLIIFHFKLIASKTNNKVAFGIVILYIILIALIVAALGSSKDRDDEHYLD